MVETIDQYFALLISVLPFDSSEVVFHIRFTFINFCFNFIELRTVNQIKKLFIIYIYYYYFYIFFLFSALKFFSLSQFLLYIAYLKFNNFFIITYCLNFGM